MELDYALIGQRIAKCRRARGLTQEKLSELAEISIPYLSNIERAVSIPSTEVIMRLAVALDTTPDAFLVGSAQFANEKWKETAQQLRGLSDRQLELAERFLEWLREQAL
ncbi:MAG: helix-turn-helix transcriptional regulator [Oscillospiraceae bacterium]|nr:helix-turn-helix transcriptional regulator [Oscillospiraceae bacterium]